MPAARDVGRTRRVKVREHTRRVAVRPAYKPPTRTVDKDVKSARDVGRAEAHKQTPAYHRQVRDVFDRQPYKRKVEIYQQARRNVDRSPEARIIVSHVHEQQRVGRENQRILEQMQARGERPVTAHVNPDKPGHHINIPGVASIDVSGPAEFLSRAVAPAANLPNALVQFATAQAIAESKGGGIAGGALRDLQAMTVGSVPTLAHFAGEITHPKKIAGELYEGAKESILHPKEHPLFAATLLHGGVSGVGRTVGAAGRRTPLRTRAPFEQRRGPVTPVGNQQSRALYQERAYSPDVIRASVQRVYDKRLRPVLDKDGRAVLVEVDKKKVPLHHAPVRKRVPEWLPGHSQVRVIRGRMNYMLSRNNAVERLARGELVPALRKDLPTREHRGGKVGQRVGEAVDRIAPPDRSDLGVVRAAVTPKRALRPEHGVLGMVYEGTIRSAKTAREDMVHELERIQAENAPGGAAWDAPELRKANLAKQRAIVGMLKDDRAMRPENLQRLVVAGRGLAEHKNELDKASAELGLADPAALERSPLFGYAITHMGARFVAKPHPSEEAAATHASHETALRTRVDEASTAEKAYVAAKAKRDRIVGKQGSQRGRELSGGQVGAGRAKRAQELEAATKAVRTARQRRNVKRRQLADAKAAEKRARPDYRHGSLRGPDGEVLTNEAIIAHAKAHGIPDPETQIGHLPHRLAATGGFNFHKPLTERRPHLETRSRTGELYRAGATATDARTVIESIVGTHLIHNTTRNFDSLLHEIAIGPPTTAAQALKIAAERGHASFGTKVPGEVDLVPMRVGPGRASEETKKLIADHQDLSDPGRIDSLIEQHFLDRRVSEAGSQAKNVVLVPAEAVKQIRDHLGKASQVGQLGRAATNIFRETVLPFSTKWLAGNWVEAAIRLAAVGAGPNSTRIGHSVLKEIISRDERLGGPVGARSDAAHEYFRGLQSHELSGLLFGQRGQTVHVTPRQAFGGAGEAVANAPLVRESLALYHQAAQGVFTINRLMEHEAAVTTLGRYASRRIQRFTGSWGKALRANEQAVKDFVDGQLNTAAQHDFARYLDETLGQYSRFGPTLRKLTQSGAPFLPWYLNSARFVFWTLPAHHPIKQAVLAAAASSFEKDWREQHKDVAGLGGEVQAMVPHNGGFRDIARFTPEGAFTQALGGGKTAPVGLLKPFFPQFQGSALALFGLNPFGDPLKGPKGEATGGQRALAALRGGGEAFVPFLALIRRLEEHGETPYDTSTVFRPQTKPGTAHGRSAAGRIFDPLGTTYFRAAGSKSKRRKKGGGPAVYTGHANSGGGGVYTGR